MQPSSSDSGPLSAKRAHRKSRTGCRNCKARRVKCDERRPLCRNCERHYSGIIQCEWEPTPETAGVAGPSAPSTSRSARSSRRGSVLSPPAIPTSAIQFPSGISVDDPFSDLVVPDNISQENLILFYYSDIVPRCFPFFGIDSVANAWRESIQTDSLLTQVAESTAAMQIERRTSQPNVCKSYDLISGCLSTLQGRLNDDAQAVSDETLIAVTQLIALENTVGNIETGLLHCQALKKMVDIRGGLTAVESSSPLASSMIFWTILVAASEPSRLPFQYKARAREHEWVLEDPISEELNEDLSNFVIEPSLAVLLRHTRNIYQRLISIAPDDEPAHCLAIVTQLCRTIQNLILFQNTTHPRNSLAWLLNEICRQAGILLLMLWPKRYYPSPILLIRAVINRLKRSLVYTLLDFSPEPEMHPILLWILCLGAVASHGSAEYEWFVKYLAFLTNRAGIRTEEELRVKIGNIMAFQTCHEFTSLGVWAQVDAQLFQLSETHLARP